MFILLWTLDSQKKKISVKEYQKNIKKKSVLEWFLDVNGWWSVILALILTIIYFFIKRGVLSDIIGIFGLSLC